MKVADQVAEDLKAMNPDVQNDLVNALVDREKTKRVDALVICYDKWQKLRGEVRRAEKPDQVSTDATGKVISESFSKKAFEALKTIREKAEKIEKAVEKALKGDMGDAYNIARDKGDGGDKGKSGTDTSATEESD